MGLFSRKSRSSKDPYEWSALWSYVGPYGGRVTPGGAQLCAQYAQGLSGEELRGVADELQRVYRVLDTEKHARHIGGYPWRGKKEMFSRARFLRAVDAVIVAGPEAVLRVRDDPALIAEYDSGLEIAPYEEADPPGTIGTRLKGQLDARQADRDADYVGMGVVPMWPMLGYEYAGLPLDPERGWVTVEVLGELSPEVTAAWQDACDVAQRRLFEVLGGPAPRSLRLGTLMIAALGAPAYNWDDSMGARTEVKADGVHGFVGTELTSNSVEFLMSPEEFSVTDLETQVRLLTSKAATIMCEGPVALSKEMLERLRPLRDETAV